MYWYQSERLYHVGLQNIENFVSAILCMDIQINRLGKVQAEGTHVDFASITYLPDTRSEVIIKFGDIVYKGLNLINGI